MLLIYLKIFSRNTHIIIIIIITIIIIIVVVVVIIIIIMWGRDRLTIALLLIIKSIR